MKIEAQPCHRQDSRRDKDALGRTGTEGDVDGSASPHKGCAPARLLTLTGSGYPTTGENASAAHCSAGLEARRGRGPAKPHRVSVKRPSWTWQAALPVFEDGLHSHDLPQRARRRYAGMRPMFPPRQRRSRGSSEPRLHRGPRPSAASGSKPRGCNAPAEHSAPARGAFSTIRRTDRPR